MSPLDPTREQLPFDRVQARLLPVADTVMLLMLSRPATGTLRTTRVTVVTIGLAALVALGAIASGVVLFLRVRSGAAALWLTAWLALLPIALGCAALAAFGVRRRLLLRRSP